MPARGFRELVVWQKAHQVVLSVYSVTADFPRDELYGLTSQMRRAAVSIPANIAEGFRRRGRKDKARSYNIGQASLEELRYYLILSQDLGYAQTADMEANLDEVGRMLDAYMQRVLVSCEEE